MPVSSFMKRIHFLFGLRHFLLSSICFCIIVFSKQLCRLMLCPKSVSFGLVIFVCSNTSGFTGSRTCVCICPVVQASCRALLQPHVPNNSFFFYQPSSLYIVIENVRARMSSDLVSKDTSLLLVIFSNSFINGLPNFRLCMIS